MKRLLLLVPILLAGCGSSFDRLEMSAIVTSDLGGHISDTSMSVPEGLALKATILAFKDDNDRLGLTIRATDPTILDVEPVVTSGAFAFIGRKAGHTDLTFTAGDDVVLIVGADVTAQP